MRHTPGASPPRAPPHPPLSFEQGGNALDQGRLVDRLAVTDDLDLEGPHDIADKAHPVDAAAPCPQRRRDGGERIAGATRTAEVGRESGDRLGAAAPPVRNAAVLAMRDVD